MKVLISLSQTVPEWFKKLPKEEQKEYLKEHPQSRIGHSFLKTSVEKVSDTATKAKTSRRSFGLMIKQKLKGVMKAMKHEVREFQYAGKAVAQLAHGKKIDEHQKKAIKNVLIHSLLVLGPMAISGGLSAGLAHVLPHAVGGFIEHSLVVSATRAAVFASESEEDPMDKLIEKFAEYVANGDISKDDWKAAFAKAKEAADPA